MIKNNPIGLLRDFVILSTFLIGGCGSITVTPSSIPSQTPTLEPTPTTVAKVSVLDSQYKLILLGMTENLTTNPEFYGSNNNLIFSSTIDGQQPRLLELLEDGRVEYVSSSGNGEVILSAVYRIITSAAPVHFGENLGKLYLHNTNLGWSRLLTDRLWGAAFFLPDRQGIIYSALDENLKPVFYFTNEDGENQRKLLQLNEADGTLISSYNSKYLFYQTEEKSNNEEKIIHIWKLSLQDGSIDEVTSCNPGKIVWISVSQNHFACINFEDTTVSIFDLSGNMLLKREWKDISRIDWSPDETKLLVETHRYENEEHFFQSFVWDVESNNITLLPVDGAMGRFGGRVSSAVNNEFWSPDGSKVLVWYDDPPVIVDVNTLEVYPVGGQLEDIYKYGVYWLR